MTVSYGSAVANSRSIGCFLHVLARWRGSIYKLVWGDLLLFLFLYYVINITYRFLLDEAAQESFEKFVTYCDTYGSLIPLSFVLGFFVNNITSRWWNQYCAIPFPDNLALLVSASVKGEAERSRIMRRTIMRYVCVSFTQTLALMSPKVKKRFPTFDQYVQAGLLLEDEKRIWENLEEEFPSYSKYWLPLAWAGNIATRARNEGLIREDLALKDILEEINKFRSKLGTMLDYDWISIPLVYTQVVTLAVYTYFLTTLFGKQYTEKKGALTLDLYFPFLPVMEFFFYMGWLKVAEVLINPFGDDDDDFEVIWMIDRHIQVCYLIVDKMHEEHPKLMRDQYWAQIAPSKLPHTLASQQFRNEYPLFSTNGVTVTEAKREIFDSDEETATDGVRKSFFNRIFHGLRRRQPKGYTRKRAGNHHIVEEIGLNESLTALDQPENIEEKLPDCDEFEELKKTRQEHARRKLEKYIQAFKQTTSNRDSVLIDETPKTTEADTEKV